MVLECIIDCETNGVEDERGKKQHGVNIARLEFPRSAWYSMAPTILVASTVGRHERSNVS